MKQVKIGKHSVVIFDNIEELPIRRFHKYNKMLLIDAGIGSDLTDLDTHIARTIAFIQTDKADEAVKEMNNLRQNIYFVHTGVSPRMLAFATLVKSIDGKDCEDMSEEALQKVLETLGEATLNEITTPFGEVKKKIDDELLLYFPAIFDTSTSKEYYDILWRHTKAVLEHITTGEEQQEEELRNRLLTYSKPKNFMGAESIEIDHDKAFETLCATISHFLHTNPKKYSVMEFYTAVEYIKAQNKPQKAQKGGL